MARSMAASVSMGLPVEERDPLEMDFYQRRNLILTLYMEVDSYHLGKCLFF